MAAAALDQCTRTRAYGCCRIPNAIPGLKSSESSHTKASHTLHLPPQAALPLEISPHAQANQLHQQSSFHHHLLMRRLLAWACLLAAVAAHAVLPAAARHAAARHAAKSTCDDHVPDVHYVFEVNAVLCDFYMPGEKVTLITLATLSSACSMGLAQQPSVCIHQFPWLVNAAPSAWPSNPLCPCTTPDPVPWGVAIPHHPSCRRTYTRLQAPA